MTWGKVFFTRTFVSDANKIQQVIDNLPIPMALVHGNGPSGIGFTEGFTGICNAPFRREFDSVPSLCEKLFVSGAPIAPGNFTVAGKIGVEFRIAVAEFGEGWLISAIPSSTVDAPYRSLYETSRDAITTLDPEKGFLAGNPAMIALFGCKDEEEFTQLTPAKISPEFQPDGRSSEEKAAEMMALAMERGSHLFEWMHQRRDGTTFWAEVLLTRLEIGGRRLLQTSVRNISERKRTQEKILALNAELEGRAAQTAAEFNETNNRLRLLIDGANDGVVTIDAAGMVIDWNPASEKIFGWTRDEAIGQPMHNLIVPERMREAHRQGLQRFLATGQGRITNKTIEISALHRSGREFDVELAIWPVRSGDSYTFSAFLRDISERKKNARLLEQRARQITLQRDVLVHLASLKITDFDQALEEILRASATTLGVDRASFWTLSQDRQQIICRCLWQQKKGAFSRDPLLLTAADFPAYFQAIDQNKSLVVEDAITHPATRDFTPLYLQPNGIGALLDSIVWIHGNALGVVCHEHVGEARTWQPEEIDFSSSIASMISLASESAERVAAQRDLLALQSQLRDTLAEREAVLENSGVGIALLREGAFVWVNQTLADLSGFSRQKLVGKPPDFLYPRSETQDHWLENAYQSLSAGHPFRIERPFVTATHENVWSRLSARCIDPANPTSGSIWTVEDISERVQAEEEIRLALEKARELNQLKTRFVAMTSHEFRTPLSTILSSSELLQHYGHKMPATECAALWKSIADSVRRMTSMLDDVLVIGRGDSGEFDLEIAPLDLKEFCDALVVEFRRTLPEKNQIAYGAPPAGSLPMDEKLLRHILVNLLSNAIKYSPAGGTIVFNVRTERDAITLVVGDEGIGIPQADLPRLFETFHRATNVGNISGTGLGLAIVKKSVDNLGGTIHVDSQEGRGTTFTVTIPQRIP